jgi:hypothetical protein
MKTVTLGHNPCAISRLTPHASSLLHMPRAWYLFQIGAIYVSR